MQIVTAIKETDNNDSLFIIKEGLAESHCETGTPIKCNSIIRLEHVNTGKNLHSHKFASFITDSQEVCAFGDNGEGNFDDNFKLICYNSNDVYLRGKTQFFLQHVNTGAFLYINIKKSLFNEYNCRGCPIMNHREVSCTNSKDKQSLWQVVGGIIYASRNDEETTDILNSPIRSVNFSPTLSFGYDFQTSQHSHLRIEPIIRYGLRGITDTKGSGNIYSAGLNVSLLIGQ